MIKLSKHIVLFFFLILVNDSCKQIFNDTDLPDDNLINSILLDVTDSLRLELFNKYPFRTYVILDSLPNIKFSTYAEYKDQPPSDNDIIFIDVLKSRPEFYLNNRPIFSKLDSSFFRYQVAQDLNYNFNKEIYINQQFIDNSVLAEEKHKHDSIVNSTGDFLNGMNYYWIKIFTPVISYDKTHAFVNLEFSCLAIDCGYGLNMILEYNSNLKRWKIIRLFTTYEA